MEKFQQDLLKSARQMKAARRNPLRLAIAHPEALRDLEREYGSSYIWHDNDSALRELKKDDA